MRYTTDYDDGVVYFGDCMEVMPRLESTVFDLILCDLPYGTTSNKWDTVLPLDALWSEYKRLLTPTGVVALTASQPFTSQLVMSNLDWFKHEWIWIKNRGSNFANTVREPMKEHESVLIFSPGKWTYHPQMQTRTGAGLDRVKYELNWRSKSENYRDFSDKEGQSRPDLRMPSTWQKFNVEVGLHPTQKPTALFEYIINTYTEEGDDVLDNAAGSGTTGVAARNTHRRFCLIEKEEKYVEIINNRLAQGALI